MKLTMKVLLACACLMIGVGGGAVYADFQTGMDAYQRGDYDAALREWKPLAESGNVEAQARVGGMLIVGLLVPKDAKQGLKWIRSAAEKGHADTQYNLGFLYYHGKEVTKDYVKAHMWFNISASSGDKSALKKRNSVEKKMTPEQIAEAQKMARECVERGLKGC